ncbi:hypothetical protein MMC10_003221 [Thelotrema lepadinum]|nr:hypothetical protein [Thelotrema lepadinum]
MAITFLMLPGEIRNEIYRWILPTPSNPSLVYVRGENEEGLPVEREKSLTPGLHRTCKTVNMELPSLNSFLLDGAIVPTVLFSYGEQVYRHGESRKFLHSLLLPATRLRIVDEQFASGTPPPPNSYRPTNWFKSDQATDVLGIFLNGLPVPSSGDQPYCGSFDANHQQKARLKKFVDIPVNLRSLPQSRDIIDYLTTVNRFDVFLNLTEVRIEPIENSQDPKALETI